MVFGRLALRGIQDLTVNPWAQALTLAAVTLVAFLGGLFLLLLHNLDLHLMTSQGQVQFQVYWKADSDMEAVRSQWEDLSALPGVRSVKTFTPELGLELLGESLPSGLDLDWLAGDNPIPPTALILVSLPRDTPEFASDMLRRFEAMPGVDAVHYNPLQLDLARSWTRFSRTVVWPLIGFLVLVVALVVGNTFKLSLLNRYDEIHLLKLVGATRWYIQLPLMVGGLVQGLLGGLIALAMLKLLQTSLSELLYIPPLWIRIVFLPATQVILILGALGLVGLLSSWVAVRR